MARYRITFSTMLGDVLRALFHKPATEKYPFERHPAPERLRGALHFNPGGCTGCGMCVRDCPANALELVTLDKKNKRFVIRYHADRCTYCAQCVKTCNYDCLKMSNDEWELAALTKEPFTVYHGNQADVESLVARLAHGDADTGEKK